MNAARLVSLVLLAAAPAVLAQTCSFFLGPQSERLTIGGYGRQLVAADVTGDGIPDLVSAVGSATPANNILSVLPGVGDGAFLPAITSPLGVTNLSGFGTLLIDLDGDETLDAVVGAPSVDSVLVMRGTGDGTFQAPASFAVGDQPFRVAVGDLNGDLLLDLVCGNGGDHTISVLMGVGNRSFQSQVTYPTGVLGPFDITLADFNNDGRPDAAVGCIDPTSSGAIVLMNNGNGTFGAASPSMSLGPCYGVAAGDVTGDGRVDLVASTNSNRIALIRGNGNGTFQPAEEIIFPILNAYSYTLAIADMNDDGLPDIVNYGRDTTVQAGYGSIGVMIANGGGSFQQLLRYGALFTGNMFGLAIADLNGDGLFDAGTTQSPNSATTFLNASGGAVAIADQPAAQVVAPGGAAVFSVSATGPNLVYQWFRNGVELANSARISGATIATLLINNCTPADNGVYTVSVSNTCNSQTGAAYLHVGQTVPSCPADFDGDGFVTGLDFDAFVASFEEGC